MTINIPLKAVAFVLYTLALLGGAFGISYAVFDWRHDDEASVTSSAPVDTGPSQAELDAQLCAAALDAVGNAVNFNSVITAQNAVDRYCK